MGEEGAGWRTDCWNDGLAGLVIELGIAKPDGSMVGLVDEAVVGWDSRIGERICSMGGVMDEEADDWWDVWLADGLCGLMAGLKDS